MSLDPSYDTQAAVLAALTASSDVTGSSLTGAAPVVYDRVPQKPSFPFIHIGDDQVLAGYQFVGSGVSEITVNVHVFSRYAGKAEVKRIAGAIRTALALALPINNFETVTWEYVSTRYMTDVETANSSAVFTEHAIVTVTYTVTALAD